MPVTLSPCSGFRYYFDDTPGLTPRAKNSARLWLANYIDNLRFVELLNEANA